MDWRHPAAVRRQTGHSSRVGRKSTGGIPDGLAASRSKTQPGLDEAARLTGGIPHELAASCSRTRPELDEAVGLPGGIPQQNAARTGRSNGDWRHPEWVGGILQQYAGRTGHSSRVGRKSTGGIPDGLAAKRDQNWTKRWG
ncbi:hypothetical protein Purlil1_12835 [Purpureocillium lilacinum]|uniref:Uncharacterized protein n=1 Tax=Purpureocillium lilacinum TaxID=33203 RepID=A0ABR0BG00_PURLI|nr:hypothetical protein Purlil1_12835 [Purpureocillium lilacinum]